MQRRESKQRGELRCAGPPSCQWNRTVAMVSAAGSFASIANTNGSESSVSASAAAPPMEQRLPSTHQLATHAARAWRRVKRSDHELVRSTGHLGEQRAGREPVRERVRQNHLIPGRDRSLSAAVTSAGANAERGSRQTRSMRSGGRTAITQSSPRRLSDFGATSSRMRSGQTRPARRRVRSRPATRASAAAAARRPRPEAVRATRTSTASAAIPARSRRPGPASGCATRCAPGKRCTGVRRRRRTGLALMRGGGVARR